MKFVVSGEKSFEIVDGRTDDGRTDNNTIRSPGAFGSGELKIEHKVDLYSSRCMHDPSFMALALIASEKMT